MRIRFLLPTLALAGGAVLVLAATAARLRSDTARSSVRTRELGNRRDARALVQAGVLRLAAPAAERWEIPDLPPFGVPPGSERGGCGPALYGAVPAGGGFGESAHQEWPSTALLPAAAQQASVPVLSLAVETCRLRHLMERPYQKGRAFEEPAFLTWFEDGAVRFESGVGARLHGGRKRHAYRKSYRFYFRPIYGLPALPRDLLATGTTAAPGVVVAELSEGRDGRRQIWHFVNALGFDVARRLGVPAPAATPVSLVLNGRPQGPYLLVERIDDDYLRRHYGHDDFDLLRPKSTRADDASDTLRRELDQWARAFSPATAERARETVDLDNLTRWLVLVCYAATSDAFQSPALRDRRDPHPRWFWIAWDLEMSFRTASPRPDHGWEKNVLAQVLRERRSVHMFALILLRRLLLEDPGYRQLFLARLSEALNHRLTPEFLAERLDHYRALAERFALPAEERRFLDQLAEFFARRPEHLLAQVERELGATAHRLTVEGPAGAEVRVDDQRVRLPWQGHYFTGQTVQVHGDGALLTTAGKARAPELALEIAGDTGVTVVR